MRRRSSVLRICSLTALALLAGAAAALLVRAQGDPRPSRQPSVRASCDFCRQGVRPDLRYLSDGGVDSLMQQEVVGRNLRAWAATDSLYHRGVFGRPGTKEAKGKAAIHFHLRAATGMTYIGSFATGAMLMTDEKALRHPFGEVYENYGVYPIRFLERVVAGEGGFCMEYALPDQFDEVLSLAGMKVHAHLDHLSDGGREKVPALSLEYPTTNYKTVDLLYEARFCGRVHFEQIVDRGDTLELQILEDLDGLSVRRWGTHRMRAIILWRSVTVGDRDPVNPRLGACAYFPHIVLKMPIFLPDLGLADLREFDLPDPIMPMDWFCRTAEHPPDWISVTPDGYVSPWVAVGPRPKILEDRFPDL
jgi:hypothetical protein